MTPSMFISEQADQEQLVVIDSEGEHRFNIDQRKAYQLALSCIHYISQHAQALEIFEHRLANGGLAEHT